MQRQSRRLTGDGRADGNEKMGWIELITQINADGSDRRSVAQSETDGVREVAQFIRAIGKPIALAQRVRSRSFLEHRAEGFENPARGLDDAIEA